jgi:hypothetical protein
VLAPGVREEFGPEAVGGMADLVAFFNAPWPPEPGASTPTSGADGTVAIIVLVVVGVVVGGVLVAGVRRWRRTTQPSS